MSLFPFDIAKADFRLNYMRHGSAFATNSLNRSHDCRVSGV